MIREGGAEPDARLRYGFRLLTSRTPDARELKVLQSNLAFHRDYFASDAARAQSMVSLGESKPDPAIAPAELAAYASVASLMLNLDEVISKE